MGIDATQPRLSWVLESKQRAQRQTAYQVVVATSEELLKSGKADLWHSGKVASEQSIQIVYAGKALVSRQRCRDKAGAYAIQGGAAAFVARVEGDYTNVVGLPLPLVAELLAGLSRRT